MPSTRPSFWRLIGAAWLHVLVMLPTTIVVALLTGFHLSTAIFAGGLATLCFLFLTEGKIPAYYGASFSYLPALLGLMASKAFAPHPLDTRIAFAQFGIIATGLLGIAIGLAVRRFGKGFLDKLLPPTISGAFTITVGLSLAANALHESAHSPAGVTGSLAGSLAWVISLATLFAIILFSLHLKGAWGQLALVLGPLAGCLVAMIIRWSTGINFFEKMPDTAKLLSLPLFSLPRRSWLAVAALAPIALASAPESAANSDEIDAQVNGHALENKKKPRKRHSLCLISGGISDLVAATIGGPAGITSEENTSLMAVNKVFSVSVFVIAALFALALACINPLVNAVYTVPVAVIGGFEIFHLGALAAHGISLLRDRQVDLHSVKNIAVIAVILIIGVGGQYQYGGNIPFFGLDIPSLAAAISAGILLNLILGLGEKKSKGQA